MDKTGIKDGFEASGLGKWVDDRATSQGQEQRKKRVWGLGSRGCTYNDAHWDLSVGGSVERPLRVHLQLQSRAGADRVPAPQELAVQQHIEWPDSKRQIRSF